MDDDPSRMTFAASQSGAGFLQSHEGMPANSARRDGQIRSQTLYTAVGATIVKDLGKPIGEARPDFHLIRERTYHR
jgi:hypothetical protein